MRCCRCAVNLQKLREREFILKSIKLSQARKNAWDQVAIGFTAFWGGYVWKMKRVVRV